MEFTLYKDEFIIFTTLGTILFSPSFLKYVKQRELFFILY